MDDILQDIHFMKPFMAGINLVIDHIKGHWMTHRAWVIKIHQKDMLCMNRKAHGGSLLEVLSTGMGKNRSMET